MSRPSFGGAVALRGGDHEHQHGHQHLQQEARVRAESTCMDKVYVIIFVLKKYARCARSSTQLIRNIISVLERTLFENVKCVKVKCANTRSRS